MYEDDDVDVNVLKAVLPLMVRLAAGYHPISYTIWYEYVRGKNLELHRRIDEAIARTQRLTIAQTHALYSELLMQPAEQALVVARSNILNLLDHIRDSVQRAGQDTTAFEAHLDAFKEGVASATSISDLDVQISSILVETQRVSADFGDLSQHLDEKKHDVLRLTQEVHRLREESHTDALSGLVNRRGFDQELERLAVQANEIGGELSLVMLDIDHFKAINDTYGHPLGDRVLTAVGHAIRECVGHQGVAARYGGEEFAVLLPGMSMAKASVLAEVIRRQVAQGKIRARKDDHPVGQVTISGGVAVWRHDGDDVLSLVERADRALYASKHAGRNCITGEDALE